MKTEKRFHIFGVGTLAVDDFLHVLAYPEPDQNARVLSKDRKFGGLIGTALAAAAKTGMHCGYGGTFGYDELSLSLRETFLQLGIDCDHALSHPEGGPTHSIIVADDTSHTRNIFFLLQKEYSSLAVPDTETIPDTGLVLVDQTSFTIASLAKKRNIPVIGDLELSGREDCDFYMAQVDHLILPYTIGSGLTQKDKPEEIVMDLHERHTRVCTALTCGEDGCYYIYSAGGESVHFQKAVPVTTVETTGCGDVFHGAYASALVQGREISFCIRYAAAAAAIYASRPSGWEYLPDREEIEALLDR